MLGRAVATLPGLSCIGALNILQQGAAWSAGCNSWSALPCRSFSSPPAQLPDPEPLPCRRVVVTGIGLVTPVGVGVKASWDALVSGATGVRALQKGDLPPAHQALLNQLPSRVGALVPRDQLSHALTQLQEDKRRNSPFMLYGLLAAEEALRDAAWGVGCLSEQQQEVTGVAMGNGMSSCGEVAETWDLLTQGRMRRVTPFFVPRILPNMAAGAVGIRWGLRGPNHAVSTACATGSHAIGDAFRMVQRGDAQVMVAGASEACVDAISLAGFSRMKALSTGYNDRPSGASRPFDKGRDGFVMGEGAGVLVLEELEHALRRGARVYAEVRGYGLSGDGHHISQPHPQGLGARLCMERALARTGLSLQDVVYINAHATSTPQGDEIEASAVREVFGPDLVSNVAVSSTKGATGHLLGAAGAVEAAFTVLALHHSLAPPTVNLNDPDPADILPGLVKGGQVVPLRPGPKGALCNSFGFGGTNASILFTTPP